MQVITRMLLGSYTKAFCGKLRTQSPEKYDVVVPGVAKQ
jgi:hypothetical protein